MGDTMHRGAPTLLAGALALALAGCGLIAGPRPTIEQDEPTGRYYQPSAVDASTSGLAVQVPDLPAESAVSLEGTFTDPEGREPIPAQDDHWWQAVVRLSPEQTSRMLAAAQKARAGYGTGAEPTENAGEDADLDSAAPMDAADDAAVRAMIVAPLEGALPATCAGGWVMLAQTSPELGEEWNSGQQLASGDILTAAALCPSERTLALDAREF